MPPAGGGARGWFDLPSESAMNRNLASETNVVGLSLGVGGKRMDVYIVH